MKTREQNRAPRRFTSKQLIVTAAVCSSMFGCAADGAVDDGSSSEPESTRQGEPMPPLNMPDEEKLNLVAELNLDSQRIKYFEPQPGVLLEVELGRPDPNRAPEPANLSIVERYEFLTGQTAPQALLEAAERARPEHPGDRSTEPPQGQVLDAHPGQEELANEGNLVDKNSWTGATSESWFRGSYCTQVHRYWGTTTNYWSGNSWFNDQTEYFRAGVFVARGSVQAVIECVNENYIGPVTHEGYYVGNKCETRIDRQVHSEVVDYGGSPYGATRYLHCINYHY